MSINKRIAFISTMMPTPTNVGGPSSLPYQLIAHRPDDVHVDIFTLNQNGISQQRINSYAEASRCKVTVVCPSLKYQLCTIKGVKWLLYRLREMPFQTLINLPKNLVENINSNYDYLWIYPHYLLGIAKQTKLPIVVTGPDSSVLHHERCLNDSYVCGMARVEGIKKAMKRNQNLETAWADMPNAQLHLVGDDDCKCFLRHNPHGHAFYLRHPSNMPKGMLPKHYDDHYTDKLSVIITGQLNIYTLSDMDIINNELCINASELSNKYKVTFVGRGWEEIAKTLQSYSYEVTIKDWVEDYFDELKCHDLQLFPISIGTGTKGKVLDALSAGIVCVGSRYAFENIHLEHGVSAYQYEDAHEVGNLLIQIDHEREHLKKIARRGYEIVCNEHNPADIAEEFFQHF